MCVTHSARAVEGRPTASFRRAFFTLTLLLPSLLAPATMHFSKIFVLAFAVGAFGEKAPTLPQLAAVADAVVPAAPDALHFPFAAGVRGDAAPPALPKLADVADAVPPAVSDAPLSRARGAAPSGAATVAAETTRAGLRASAPETRGTLKLESKWKAHETLKPKELVAGPDEVVAPFDADEVVAPPDAPKPHALLLDVAGGPAVVAAAPRTRGTLKLKERAHGTAYSVQPAPKLKGHIDLSSPSSFDNRVSIATNHSSGIAVQEDTEFFFTVTILTIITAVVIDEVVNDGGVRHAVGEAIESVVVPLYGFFMEVLNPLIAAIFEAIGQAIVDALNLDLLDEAAMRIINGGMANRFDIITSLLGSTFQRIRDVFDRVVRWVTTIRDGLDAIGALDFTRQIVGNSRSNTLAMINDEPEEERIEITDGKGNTGYLSSDERNLIQSSDGLEDLMNALKGNSMINRMTSLKNRIEALRDSLNNNSSTNAMASIKTELANIFRNAQSAFQGFLDKTSGLGSLQFLVTGEAAAIAGVGLEAGISIDVRQILHFFSHNFQWDRSVTQLLSFHVGYALDIGAQAGGDVGFCVGYHTSRVTGVKHLFALAHVHN